MQSNFRRSGLHINTLPPWSNENILDDILVTKDPRETLEAVKQLLETGTAGPNIYIILATMPNGSVKLNIPETLIKLPHQPTVYLYTDEKGFVRTKADENCLSAFFKNTKLENANDGIPNYLHADETIHICIDSKEALHWWAVCKSPLHMLQKFISPCKKRLQKLRVYWKAKYGLRFLIISSLSVLPKVSPKNKKSAFKAMGIYQHKISDYTFAGRLFRASFDPTMPNKSLIGGQNTEGLSPRDLGNFDSSADKHFLVKFSDRFNCSITEVPVVEEVKQMMTSIIQCINTGSSYAANYSENKHKERDSSIEGENLVTTEVIVDFMPDKQGEWKFIECKIHKMDYIPTKYNALFPMKTLSSNYFNRSEESLKNNYEPFLSIASLTSRLNTLGKKSKEFSKNQKVPLSNSESSESIYLSHFSELNQAKTQRDSTGKDKLTNLYSMQISKIADHYDKIRGSAKKNKVETIRRKTMLLSEPFVETVAKSIIERLELNPELKKVAEVAEPFFCQFLAKVVEEERNIDFFFKFQKNLDWKIGMKQFRAVCAVVVEQCKKFSLFTTSELVLLGKSLQKLEVFIFRNNYS